MDEAQILELLQGTELADTVRNQLRQVVRTLCVKAASAQVLRDAVKRELLRADPVFNEKIIHSVYNEYQSYSATLHFDIPLKYLPVNGRFVDTDEPSMSYEAAIDRWLDVMASKTPAPTTRPRAAKEKAAPSTDTLLR